MPDISKCVGDTCPLKDRCYRYTSKPSEHHQSYLDGVPWDGEDCEFFYSETRTGALYFTGAIKANKHFHKK